MVKIETSVQISQDFPAGKSSEYIWMLGQPWPVPEDGDAKILRVEAFGEELAEMTKRFAGGQSIRDSGATGNETCRTWYLQEARYVSAQMRIFYPNEKANIAG